MQGLLDGGSYSGLSVSAATLIRGPTLIRGNKACCECKKA